MNLQVLLDATRQESEARQRQEPLDRLKAKIRDLPPSRGFAARIAERRFSLIAEVKAKSPSMGEMNPAGAEDIATVHRVYDQHPVVAAISVLTQETHFGGSPAALRRIRGETRKPILRKDFIFSSYEVHYSRLIEADALLLMANVITDKAEFRDLHDLALQLGMDVLCEVHEEAELELLPPTAKLVGVNARSFASASRFRIANLLSATGKDFTTDLAAFEIFGRLPAGCLKVAESGLNSKNIDQVLKQYGFNAALVGTSLLRGGLKHTAEELDRFQQAISP